MISMECLMDGESQSEYSPFFAIPTNGLGIIQAFGFPSISSELITTQYNDMDITSEVSYEPAACVYMALFSDPGLPVSEPCSAGIIDLNKYTGVLKLEELVLMNGCPWQISACNNIVLLDLPGQYRLKLNSPDLVGQVSIYVRYYHKTDFKANSLLFFGG